MNPIARRRSAATTLAILLAVSCFAWGATADGDGKGKESPFPSAQRAAIERALDKAFAESKAPGAAVGIWTPGEGALDDPIGKYLAFVPNGQNITLRMMANMTSGLFNHTEDDAWVTKAFSDFKRNWTPRELVDVGLAHPPYFAHGVTEQTLDNTKADATNRNPSWAFTAGQLISTLGDLRIWIRSCATGSLLSPQMQQERLTWVTLPPNTPIRKYGLGIGVDNGWLGHSGELPGYNTGAYYLPEKDAVMVVMVNSDIAVNNVNPMTGIFKALTAVITPDHVPN